MEETGTLEKPKTYWEMRAILKTFTGLSYWKGIEFILCDSKVVKSVEVRDGFFFFLNYKRKTC